MDWDNVAMELLKQLPAILTAVFMGTAAVIAALYNAKKIEENTHITTSAAIGKTAVPTTVDGKIKAVANATIDRSNKAEHVAEALNGGLDKKIVKAAEMASANSLHIAAGIAAEKVAASLSDAFSKGFAAGIEYVKGADKQSDRPTRSETK